MARSGQDKQAASAFADDNNVSTAKARGTYIYPPSGSMRLVTDTFIYGSREVPQWNNGVFSPRMYAIALIRYRKPLEQVFTVLEEHRAYLRTLKEKGLLLVSGPLDPRSGGALLLRVPDQDSSAVLDDIRDADPFIQKGIAQYELLPWVPTIGAEDLDRL